MGRYWTLAPSPTFASSYWLRWQRGTVWRVRARKNFILQQPQGATRERDSLSPPRPTLNFQPSRLVPRQA